MEITIDNEVYTLGIEKAKECGALTRKDNRVKSWEEYLTKHKNSPVYLYEVSKDEVATLNTRPTFVEQQLTTKDAEAIWALSRLMKLRRDWVGDWEPKFNGEEECYVIRRCWDKLEVECELATGSFLTFPTEEDAVLFLKYLWDLIEMSKNYI